MRLSRAPLRQYTPFNTYNDAIYSEIRGRPSCRHTRIGTHLPWLVVAVGIVTVRASEWSREAGRPRYRPSPARPRHDSRVQRASPTTRQLRRRPPVNYHTYCILFHNNRMLNIRMVLVSRKTIRKASEEIDSAYYTAYCSGRWWNDRFSNFTKRTRIRFTVTQ